MRKQKFLRLGYTQYSKLGLRRKKKQTYRKARGRDNKVRLKMKGHLRNVVIGFRGKKSTRGLVRGLSPVLVYSIEDLKKLKKNEIAIIAKMGDKKKMEIADYAVKNNIRLSNLNPGKFLTEIQEKMKAKKEEKAKKHGKKVEKEKKAKEVEKKETKEGKETELEKTVNNSDIKNKEEIKK